jgi:peptide/nickel transport system substrate-binding protein
MISPEKGGYCVAKAGLSMATQLFAVRLAEHAIPVFEIRPGLIITEMSVPVRQRYGELIEKGSLTPIRRWGMPEGMQRELPGYDPDVAKSREKARAIMAAHGFGQDKRLKLKLSTRNLPTYRDASVILISQLKEIFIDAELQLIETAQWVPKLIRRDYDIGLSQVGNGVDDPDQNYYENFSCKSERNYTGYCNPEIEKLFDVQSSETDIDKRRKIVWEIDRKLLEDGARPIIMWNRASICMQPYVKGYVAQVNSVYNGFRFEDVWLDK